LIFPPAILDQVRELQRLEKALLVSFVSSLLIKQCQQHMRIDSHLDCNLTQQISYYASQLMLLLTVLVGLQDNTECQRSNEMTTVNEE